MLASLPPAGDEENKKEDDGRMVSLIVTVDEELLRRIETSVHLDFAGELTTKVAGEHATTKNEPGKLQAFRPNGSLNTLHSQLIFQMIWI